MELLIGWLQREFKNDPEWPTLLQFLDEDVRRDLFNVSIYAWTLGLTELADEAQEPFFRAAQYLIERGYFSPDEIPSLRRAVDDNDRKDSQRLLAWLQRLIRARVRDDVPLEFLATPDSLAGSLFTYLEATPDYAKRRREWQAQLKTDPNAAEPDAQDVLHELIERLFAGAIQLGGDTVTVVLKIDRPAIFTNGSWSHEPAQIKWSKKNVGTEEMAPRLIYAVWDDPNEGAQKTHFGTVALQGQSLLDYCTWYHGLTDGERREWDELVGKLRPGPTLSTDLKSFRFSHEPVGDDASRSLASPAVEVILRESSDRGEE